MIDRATVERILDATEIVDVVSEFVTLRKRGVNMEHEQITYPEALRWLARKYNIEIKERELTDEERLERGERESMFIVNEWAMGYFSDVLNTDPDGLAIGKQYFRSRGFRDDIIARFNLGFALSRRDALSATAIAKGYKEEYLIKTGLCYKKESGGLVDRYAGRVIFPWINVSGKVVAFGGRLLDSRTKGVQQKYVNSPDSDIYHKDHELYGIFHAKKAIVKEDRVFMVEGYTDVISMHQCGIENVVANSGTALSTHQIRLLRRFTPNIVLLYDGDEAGIHAAMRGTDMLLSEGMNIKVLVLPDGDDPDSFARKHTAEEFRSYIEQHQTDFIEFKTEHIGDTKPDNARHLPARVRPAARHERGHARWHDEPLHQRRQGGTGQGGRARGAQAAARRGRRRGAACADRAALHRRTGRRSGADAHQRGDTPRRRDNIRGA